jgi:hypothetical protein
LARNCSIQKKKKKKKKTSVNSRSGRKSELIKKERKSTVLKRK